MLLTVLNAKHGKSMQFKVLGMNRLDIEPKAVANKASILPMATNVLNGNTILSLHRFK